MSSRNLKILAGLTLSLIISAANAQPSFSGRIAPPGTTSLPPALSAAQVEQCLFLARDIATLSDEAERAKRANDISRYNATVNPYNGAISRWNDQCTDSYRPGDMIRAENKNGFKLCTYTSSPCLSEAERQKILDNEKAQTGTRAFR